MIQRFLFCAGILWFCTVLSTSGQTLSWQPASNGLPQAVPVTAIVSFPNARSPINTIAIAGTSSAGLYRTSDSGKTWGVINIGLGSRTIQALTIFQGSIYAGTLIGIYRSDDQGERWTLIANADNGLTNTSIGTFVGLNNILYAGTRGGGIVRTTNGGLTWTPFNFGLPNLTVTALTAASDSILLAGSQTGVVRCNVTDRQPTWRQPRIIPLIAPITSLVTNTVENRRFSFAGTFGAGVLRTSDEGQTWQQANMGLEGRQVTGLAVLGGTTIIAATYDRGVYISNDNGVSWSEANFGLPSTFVTNIAVGAGIPYASIIGGGAFRAIPVRDAPPIINTVFPSTITAGTQTLITITGRNFTSPFVRLDGRSLAIQSFTPTQVIVSVPGSELMGEPFKSLEVVNNLDLQGARATIRINPPTAPFISRFSPASITVASVTAFPLDILGANFDSNSVVTLGGVPLPITRGRLFSALFVDVPAEAINAIGFIPLRVTNPNGEFAEARFNVRARPPRVDSLRPSAVSAGNRTFNLTISGTDITTIATVTIGGTPVRVVSATNDPVTSASIPTPSRLVVTVPAPLVSSIGTLTIRVENDDGQFTTFQLPVIDFNVAFTLSQSRVCPGTPVTITGSINGGIPPFRIVSWKPGVDSSRIDGRTITAFVRPRDQFSTYVLTVADANGVEIEPDVTIRTIQATAVAEPPTLRFDTVNTFVTRFTTNTFRIRNTSIDSTTITLGTPRTNTNNFAVITPPNGMIINHSQLGTAITVQFQPSSDGSFRDTLFVPFEPCGGVVAIPLSGQRITPILREPVPFVVQVPPSGTFGTGQVPQLSWTSVPEAASYALQVARVERMFSPATGFINAEFPVVTTANTGLQPPYTLQPNTAYMWSVRSVNSATTSTWTVPQYFITAPVAMPRVRISPAYIDFASPIISTTERRGIQIQNTTAQPAVLLAPEVFSSTPNVFSSIAALNGTQVAQRLPFNGVVGFRPADTSFYQGIMRIRTTTNDTLLMMLVGRGVNCVNCAETDVALRFRPFKNNRPRPDVGDTVTLQLVLTRSARLDDSRYADRARRFTTGIIVERPDVLLPLNVQAPANLSAQQAEVSRTRFRLTNVPTQRSTTGETVLAEMRLWALLADTLSTAVRITEFAWTDITADTPIRKTLRDTSVTLETYNDGTPRLIRPRPGLIAFVQTQPNPVSDVATVKFSLNTASPLEVFLVDVMGRRVRTLLHDELQAQSYTMTLNTNDLPTGAYLLVLQTPTETISHRLEVFR